MSSFKIDENSKIQFAYPQWGTCDEVVKNFKYEHRLVFDKYFYDKPVEVKAGVWKMLKLTDPRTFEYRTITTDIEFIFDYKSIGYPYMSKIIIHTIDDAFMNLWMKKQSEDSMWYYIRHFEAIPMLHSCEFEYEVFIRRFPDIISNKEVVEISFN